MPGGRQEGLGKPPSRLSSISLAQTLHARANGNQAKAMKANTGNIQFAPRRLGETSLEKVENANQYGGQPVRRHYAGMKPPAPLGSSQPPGSRIE